MNFCEAIDYSPHFGQSTASKILERSSFFTCSVFTCSDLRLSGALIEVVTTISPDAPRMTSTNLRLRWFTVSHGARRSTFLVRVGATRFVDFARALTAKLNSGNQAKLLEALRFDWSKAILNLAGTFKRSRSPANVL